MNSCIIFWRRPFIRAFVRTNALNAFTDAEFVAAECPDIELIAKKERESVSSSTATISQQTVIIITQSASGPKSTKTSSKKRKNNYR